MKRLVLSVHIGFPVVYCGVFFQLNLFLKVSEPWPQLSTERNITDSNVLQGILELNMQRLVAIRVLT
eukprot:958705-Amphidinium_carterae.3